MSITATELKNNLGHYLSLAAENEIVITQYGKVIAVLTNPSTQKINKLASMRGFLKEANYDDIEDAKWEALSKKCGL